MIIDVNGVRVFQSTRPRGARHLRRNTDSRHADVSIHAPARGATGHNFVLCECFSVSIHAPARGATPPPPLKAEQNMSFNPRAREGRDLTKHYDFSGNLEVSIHAPARGATLCSASLRGFLVVSIHAPARGATAAPIQQYGSFCCFNPRAREGRDISRLWLTRRASLLFQSTRPRGARRTMPCGGVTRRMFQSTRPRGARRGLNKKRRNVMEFQSTRPRGARPAR